MCARGSQLNIGSWRLMTYHAGWNVLYIFGAISCIHLVKSQLKTFGKGRQLDKPLVYHYYYADQSDFILPVKPFSDSLRLPIGVWADTWCVQGHSKPSWRGAVGQQARQWTCSARGAKGLMNFELQQWKYTKSAVTVEDLTSIRGRYHLMIKTQHQYRRIRHSKWVYWYPWVQNISLKFTKLFIVLVFIGLYIYFWISNLLKFKVYVNNFENE